jgi:hypothetical protein
VTLRAIEILKGLLKSSETATGRAAREALEKIAKSDKAAAARRARSALEPEPVEAPQNLGGIVLGGAGGMARIEHNFGFGAAGGMKSVSVMSANGVREINVRENGTTIRITDGSKDGIILEVTTAGAQKAATRTYKAKDAAELKKNHPEAYALYKEYAGKQDGAGIVQVQVGNAGFTPGRFRINDLIRSVNQLAARLASPATREDLRTAAPRAKGQLLEKIERLKRELDLLAKRLKAPAAKPETGGKK